MNRYLTSSQSAAVPNECGIGIATINVAVVEIASLHAQIFLGLGPMALTWKSAAASTGATLTHTDEQAVVVSPSMGGWCEDNSFRYHKPDTEYLPAGIIRERS
jgi:hypothetical protein